MITGTYSRYEIVVVVVVFFGLHILDKRDVDTSKTFLIFQQKSQNILFFATVVRKKEILIN